MLAKEGLREMALATVVCGAAAWGLALLHPLAAIVPLVVWIWAISFFRDPPRRGKFQPGEMCSPADGTVTEISRVEHDERIGGPALRLGIFLSIFNVHINRAPCAGVVRKVTYAPGLYLDARHPDSGAKNESNALLIEPDAPHAGPILVRQVAGLIARRIICHAGEGDRLTLGERFGLIKFGSRTELIVPHRAGVDIPLKVGDKVKAGLTVVLRESVADASSATQEIAVESR